MCFREYKHTSIVNSGPHSGGIDITATFSKIFPLSFSGYTIFFAHLRGNLFYRCLAFSKHWSLILLAENFLLRYDGTCWSPSIYLITSSVPHFDLEARFTASAHNKFLHNTVIEWKKRC